MCNQNKPHRHAEIIKAWADGKAVQFSNGRGCFWMDLTTATPTWTDDYYRIKPEPKPDFICHARIEDYNDKTGSYRDIQLHNLAKAKDSHDNVKLTFDGETYKLKNIEFIG